MLIELLASHAARYRVSLAGRVWTECIMHDGLHIMDDPHNCITSATCSTVHPAASELSAV